MKGTTAFAIMVASASLSGSPRLLIWMETVKSTLLSLPLRRLAETLGLQSVLTFTLSLRSTMKLNLKVTIMSPLTTTLELEMLTEGAAAEETRMRSVPDEEDFWKIFEKALCGRVLSSMFSFVLCCSIISYSVIVFILILYFYNKIFS